MDRKQETKIRAPRNRTLTLTDAEREEFLPSIIKSPAELSAQTATNVIINGDYNDYLDKFEPASIDMLFLDPPYNLSKSFNGKKFCRKDICEYTSWLEQIIVSLLPLLKPTATVYICGDWFSSVSIFSAASKHLRLRNRITWEREKGRGAKANFKNACEDIFFCTVGDNYTFNLDAVKHRRRVLAPYSDEQGRPKDWTQTASSRFRDTHPSNLWTDITIPFWSMPENTDHPTQKSEKLLAKLILASTNPGDIVLDPFAGSGTTAVTAEKLDRRYIGVEIDTEYCLLAAKRIKMAKTAPSIQGFEDGVFWERNTLAMQKAVSCKKQKSLDTK